MNKLKRTFSFILQHPLAKRHIVMALSRFLWWQLQATLFPNTLFVKKYLSPLRVFARKGLTGITGNLYTGLHEFNDMFFLLHFLRAGDAFFDVGANVGSYTLLASGISGARTLSIEPAEATFALLEKNIRLNKLEGTVTAYLAAAGAEDAKGLITTNEDTTNHIVAADEKDAAKQAEVRVIRIDTLSQELNPILIKIDVEGFETEVLKGMSNTLKQNSLKALIIELNGSGNRYGFDEKKIHDSLLLSGFKACLYQPYKRQLIVTDEYGSHNTIYCRDIDFINERLKNANAIKIMGESI